MGNSISDEDEYPIIWCQPNFNSQEEKVLLVEKRPLIYFFSELEEMLKFCESLDTSFLAIVPNDLLDEEKLLKDFEIFKEMYARRLNRIEEDSIITELKVPQGKSQKVYAFCTRKDFENEVLVYEEIKNSLTRCGVKEAASWFCSEFMHWEKNKGGHCHQFEMAVKNEDFLKCRDFCLKVLKDIARKRKREKTRILCYLNLVFCCFELKKYQEAVQYAENVLGILQFIYGDGHTLTAASYNNVGTAYFDLKNHKKAREFYAKALDIRKALYGEMHFLTASSYNNVAVAENELGEHQIAIGYLLKAIAAEKSFYGESHSETLISTTNLAMVYERSKEYQKALEYYFKALEISKKVNGEKHPEFSKLHNNIAEVYESLKEYQKALEFYFKSLSLTKALYGESNARTETLYRWISDIYQNLEEDEKSLEYQAKYIFVRASLRGEINAEIADLYTEVAEEYEGLGKYQQAFWYYLKALKIYRVTNGEDHTGTEAADESVGSMFHGLEKGQKKNSLRMGNQSLWKMMCCLQKEGIQYLKFKVY